MMRLEHQRTILPEVRHGLNQCVQRACRFGIASHRGRGASVNGDRTMPTYSLDAVTINGFRGLRHLNLEGLGRVTVLVGENNSGKTSVLEAMSILCNPLQPSEWLSLVRRRDFGGLDETRVQSIRWCFHQTGQLATPDAMFEATCEMTCRGQFPLRRLQVEYRDVLGDLADPEIERLSARLQRLRIREPDIDVPQPMRGSELIHTADFDELFRTDRRKRLVVWEEDPIVRRPIERRGISALSNETLTPYSYQVNRLQVRSYSESNLAQRGEALELVRQFDQDVESIEVASFRGARPSLYVVHRRLGPAPLSVFGDALRRVVLLATTVATLKNGLLFIDEAETGVHVSALPRVFKWLTEAAARNDVQVVATTHSLEAVDALLAGVEGKGGQLVAFHLDQTQEATRARRFDQELLSRLRRERGLDVR